MSKREWHKFNKPVKGKRGKRPVEQRLTKKRREQAVAMRKVGMSYQAIHESLGISGATWYRWLNRRPDFELELLEAQQHVKMSLYKRAFDIAMSDGKDAARMVMFLLERIGGLHRQDVVEKQRDRWENLGKPLEPEQTALHKVDAPRSITFDWPRDSGGAPDIIDVD